MSTELVDRFERPSVRYGPLPLWWWSGERLDRERLRWQMGKLIEQGVWQAVVMNLAPTGPLYGALADDPPFMSEEWWDIFTSVAADAEQLGFQIWLYDQIGFSGANLQGRIVADEPRHAGRSIAHLRVDARPGAELTAPPGAEPISAWIAINGEAAVPVPLDRGIARCGAAEGDLVLCYAVARGFDYFSASACAALIDTVYGEYERRVGGQFGRGIGGVFQDELPDVPTWSVDFAPRFRAAFGYDLESVLPALWGDGLPADAPVDADLARLHYHRARARFAREAFFDPLSAWLRRAGLPCGFDQQSPAREGMPIGAVEHYADYLDTHSGYAIPGNDHWGDAKVHSSLAHAHGHERVWIEAFHSSGWGGTLEETYDWLAPFLRRGANLYDPHAVYYSTRAGWFEWAPPSTCWRQPYWPDYHGFAEAVMRLCSVLTAGDHVASTVLLYPTETVQMKLTADGRDLGAEHAQTTYLRLNGLTPWFAERRGALERAGIDYDILGSASLQEAEVRDGELVVAGESYRNVVLPAIDVLPARVAGLLADLAEAGGTIVCVGRTPGRVVDADGSDGDAAARFAAAVAGGRVALVAEPEHVADHLEPSAVAATADAPVVHRRVGSTHLIAAFAHDELTGTVQPMLDGFDDPWSSGDFDWPTYWERLGNEGYRFVPPTGRRLTVQLRGAGVEALQAQLWDPRTGDRCELAVHSHTAGVAEVSCDFPGTASIIVFGADLPAATAAALGGIVSRETLEGPWSLRPESTLDNRWGDLDAPDKTGIVPVQVWQLHHGSADARPDELRPAIATFGDFAEVAADDDDWRPVEWSLSRGIRNDPIHDASLGPNGYVPEEFVLVRGVVAGARRRLRTTIAVPDDDRVRLAVGANAARSVRFDGELLETGEPGYLTLSPLATGRTGLLEIDFLAAEDGDLRAFFALTTEPERFARPEWIEAADRPARATTVVFATEVDVPADVRDARVQLSTEAPSVLVVNGVEIGRQSDFDPYAARRFTRVHPYDLRDVLRPGANLIEVRCTDVGREVAVRLDSVPRAEGGLGVRTDRGWSVARDGAPVAARQRLQQFEDPRYGCLVARPHPLQRATWLEPEGAHASVVALVPDLAPDEGRTELLAVDVPLGAVSIDVPTDVPFELVEGGVSVTGTRVELASPATAGTRLTLLFHPTDGRRGGALLDGPLTVECDAADAELVEWSALGLGNLGGAVHYERPIRADVPAGGRAILDLGALRGTAEIAIDGVRVASLFAGPWRVDITDAVADGREHALRVTVRGTLAPYLDAASPTSAVMAGQTVQGLFGPVCIEVRDGKIMSDTTVAQGGTR
ncbi:hypothetical protein ACLKM7_07385 [Microbacterium sp. I2]|uniref:hypothetical protein n=1 Tax=Microbacterium sp. I2 TaxID=3391826 RepID=UPI003ED8E6C3